MGKISRVELQRVNKVLRHTTGLNQWLNTKSVIEWFKSIKEKNSKHFIKYDIKEFYPSITETLLINALNWASQYTKISQDKIDIILHARKSFLFDNENPWIKRNRTVQFDVPMGSLDGAEICEICGLYILDKITTIINLENNGLYRDDGLIVMSGNGRQMDIMRKNLIAVYKENGLDITVEPHSKRTSYLDITLDLENNTYEPFKKPNSNVIYIDKGSNHPPSIIRSLPKMISKRLSSISVNEEIFNRHKQTYENALKKSGYKEKLVFDNTKSTVTSINKRKRKILWYTPPFNLNVSTNLARQFLTLVKKHFNKDHKLYSLFNKNNVKVSYSCTRNMKALIANSNKSKLATNEDTPATKNCNCEEGVICPLDGNCLESTIVYKATVKTIPENSCKEYIGATEGTFKSRLYNHTKSFRNREYSNDTVLSKHIWELRKRNKNFSINWKILKKATRYKPGANNCDLCTTEKVLIAKADQKYSLNVRSELLAKCRHQVKYLLSSQKGVT